MKGDFFSIYDPPLSNTTPRETISLEDVWYLITGDRYKADTQRVRSLLLQGQPDEYKEQKKRSLPTATFGGVFSTRGSQNLQSASGLVTIDLDHISGLGLDIEGLRSKLSTDKKIGVRLVFASPSGDGLKVICKTSAPITDNKSYKAVFDTLLHYVSERYNIPIGDKGLDKSGSDVSRACLLCYDPEARLQTWKNTFNPEDHPLPKRETPRTNERPLPSYSYDLGDGIEEIVRRVEYSGVDIAPTYGDYIKLCYSFSSLGERGRTLLHRVCSLSPKYKREDTDKDFDNCSRSGETQSIGTFVNMAKSMGIDVTKPVEIPTPAPRVNNYTPPQAPEAQDPEEKFKDYLRIPDLTELANEKREGITTKYRFTGKGKEEYLTLRSGAMTLICGKSSHGKSKFLQNLALQIAKDMDKKEEEGSVLFFTYEEELADVLIQFANIYTDIKNLSDYGTPNTEVIRDYFKTGDLPRCPERTRPEAKRKLSSFRGLHTSGRLRVYYSDLSSQALCEVIHYLTSKIKVKAVFVDYVQLLYREGNKKDRREEIKDICNDLRTTAIELGLPVVLSAQLNRATPNPTDMSEDNVADSADLTRYANTILCLWSSYFDNVSGGKESYLNTEDGKRLQSRGFVLGEGGKLYAKLTKNRGGTPNIDTILSFVGETGSIPTNEDLPMDTSPQIFEI